MTALSLAGVGVAAAGLPDETVPAGVMADDATTRFSTSLAEELGRPADGEGVAVEFDWLLRGMAIFIRNPALSELITLNCCC